MPTINFSSTTFAFPQGEAPILTNLNGAISGNLIGLVGSNGAGKTTLLRLISGELTPTAGTINVSDSVGYLRQDLLRRPGSTIADLFSISETLAALSRIAAGSIDPLDFDVVGNDWDIEDRALDALRTNVPTLTGKDLLSRPVAMLSGGEAMATALTGLQIHHHPIVCLDEPTNNLDARARLHVQELIMSWKATVIVVSHDVELLRRMDRIVEIRSGELNHVSGNYDVYVDSIDREQRAALRDVKDAERKERIEKQERIEAEVRMTRAISRGTKVGANLKTSRTAIPQLRMYQQESQGKLRRQLERYRDSVAAAVDTAEANVRDDDVIRIDLPNPEVPAGRRLVEIQTPSKTVVIQGPERIAIVGDNGVGKTTLLATLFGSERDLGSRAHALTERLALLTQNLDDLDDAASAVETIAAVASSLTAGEIRSHLAKFLIRKDKALRAVSSLSGGERFRIALARVLLMEPIPQLLVLDEPTNNLDLDSARQLTEALRSYHGALLVVSHDQHFLDQLGLTTTYELQKNQELVEIDR